MAYCVRFCCFAVFVSVVAICLSCRPAYWYRLIEHQYSRQVPPFNAALIYKDPIIDTHADRKVYLKHGEVVKRLKAFPSQAESSDVFHPGMLAEIELSPMMYGGLSEMPNIAISSTPQQHKILRTFFNKRLHDGGGNRMPHNWSPAALRKSADEFIRESGDTLKLDIDVCAWVDLQLWKVILDVDVELGEAREFCAEFQSSTLIHMMLPDWTKRLPSDPLKFEEFKKLQMKIFTKMRSSPQVREEAKGSAAVANLLAHGALDAISLAGGLSVPSVITKSIWVLYNGTGLYPDYQPPLLMGDPKLSESPVRRTLALEVARLFPEVTHVPLDISNGSKEHLMLSAALREESIWGTDANSINLYPTADVDGMHGLIFASYANLKPIHHSSRGCPGAALALDLIDAFLGALNAVASDWTPQVEAYAIGGHLTRIGSLSGDALKGEL